MLGHGIAEEVGVGVAQLLVKEVDDAPPTPCAGMGQKRLRHSRRAFGVDCHCLNIGRMVDGFGRIEIEHGGAVHQDTPVVQSGGELLDHRGSCGGIGQVTGYDLGRRQGGGQRLRVEGGAQTAAAFLRAGLVDELLLYRAPILIGGGKPGIADIGLTALADAHGQWRRTDFRQLGNDTMERYERC